MPSLQIVSKEGRIYNFPVLKDEIAVGRSKDNDIVLSDSTVSRNHARIVRTDEGCFLQDLGSFNGTTVNREKVNRIRLQHEDVIRIGLNKLTYLTREKAQPVPSDSLILIQETDEPKDRQRIVRSSPQASAQESQGLLFSTDLKEEGREKRVDTSRQEAGRKHGFEADLSSLERSNKVLFVLYEISRQLNSIHDFNELLKRIMDLIFAVIDADSGFLILTGDEVGDELIPVVIKYREGQVVDGAQLKASRTIISRVIQDKVALLTSNAMADSRLDHGKSLFIQQIRSAMCVPLWKKDKIIGVIQLESVRLHNQFSNDDLELLKAIGSQMAMVIEQASLDEQIREEELMRSRLERFHSPQIVEMILSGGQDIMEPNDLTATIIFTDIIGFSHLAEKMPPRDINMLLNQYFTRMTDIVFAHGGTLDKYIGDGLMALFGAPMEKEDDAIRAIRAAKDMRQALTEMMDKAGSDRRFSIRIGINTGRVVAGSIGSPQRMDYTVLGDPVNIASRLESIAGPNQILIGEETYNRVKGAFKIRKVGPRKVKGKSSEILVYEVV